jgi:hypothetical protein
MRAKNNLYATIEIDQFIDHIQLSKARRPVYYKITPRSTVPPTINKKIEAGQYVIVNGGFVVDRSTGLRVVKNAKTAGTPKLMKIAGQDLWVGMDHHLRSKLAKEMKMYFWNYLKDIKPIKDIKQYPIGIKLEIQDVYNEGDLDNMEHVYRKTIHDVLCGNVEFVKGLDGKFKPDRKKYYPIIIDDSKEYIQEIISSFIPIADHEKRKLIITIYKL